MSDSQFLCHECPGGMVVFPTWAMLSEHAQKRHAHPIEKIIAGARLDDAVNHPPHYKAHPSGVECITITEHFNFNLGNVIKYVWRAGEKGAQLEDLNKALWYLEREIARLEGGKT